MANTLQFPSPEKHLEFLIATRASLATLLGGAVTALTALTAIGAVYATYRSYLSTQDKQLADTLSNATELLGSHKIPMRLGGIYAMRRIARTSKQDYLAVMQILTGLVREQCRANSQSRDEDGTFEDSCPADVQAVLTILGERPWKKIEGDFVMNLSEIHLYGASFTASDLSRARFQLAHLSSIDFSHANLTQVDLSECKLSRCSFEKARLHGAILKGAVFTDVTGLTQEQLKQARGDHTTILPKDLRYPDSWIDG